MHINLIGPGRLGKALAASLIHTGEHKLLGVYHPNFTHAQQAADTLGQGTPINTLTALPKADITCITCPDDNGGPDDPEVVYEVTLIHIPQCLSSNQITTWKEVIDKSQNKEAQNGEKQ